MGVDAGNRKPRAVLKRRQESLTTLRLLSRGAPKDTMQLLGLRRQEAGQGLVKTTMEEGERRLGMKKMTVKEREAGQRWPTKARVNLLEGLVQEVARFLRVSVLLVLTPPQDRDVCVKAARRGYHRSLAVTCRLFNLPTHNNNNNTNNNHDNNTYTAIFSANNTNNTDLFSPSSTTTTTNNKTNIAIFSANTSKTTNNNNHNHYNYNINSSIFTVATTTIINKSKAVLLLTGHQESGDRVGEAVVEVWRQWEIHGRGHKTPPHVLVFLPSSTVTSIHLPSSAPRLNFCLLQPRDDMVEFKEVFTFGEAQTVAAEEVVWTWRVNDKTTTTTTTTMTTPYRGDVLAPRDFMGNVVRMAISETSPYVMMGKDARGRLHPTGYIIDLIHLLQQQLNFTVEWVETEDGEYGVPTDSGQWTGMVGDLQKDRADVALGSFSYTLMRSSVIDFSPAIDYSSLRVLIFTQGENQLPDWSTYLHIFHWKVWGVLCGLWVVMSAGVVIVARPLHNTTLYNYLFSFIGAFAQQGSEVAPQCFRGRLVFLSLWAGSVLVYTSYTARLTSQLAVVNVYPPFTTLEEALTSANYRIAVDSGTSYITTMKSSRDRGLVLLYSLLQANPSLMVKNEEEGLNLLHDTKHKSGYLQLQTILNYKLHGNCSYKWVGQEYIAEYLYLAYRKDLQYANVLSAYIMKATASGILAKIRGRWINEDTSTRSCSTTTSDFSYLGLNKTFSAFVLLGIGGVLSVTFLLVEICVGRLHLMDQRTRRRKRKKELPQHYYQDEFSYKPHLQHLHHHHTYTPHL
ncbi:hypothetical protein Pmani_010284 [Petrolisthes manimaculis]|uniref:Uncharacterized protein n=1 Tax=Petrolisthes manimaculis TaxID=1843537 RepID=A0AAE1UFQ9_9EUCA|nr:hypothetical protein Pmani_010284 [Petrolisthes manimaculis]